MKRNLLLLLASFSLATLSLAEQTPAHKVLVLKDRNGTAIHGYDTVAYFTDNKALKGNAKFQSEYDGAKYFFATAAG